MNFQYSKDLFYQLALNEFSNFGIIELDQPAHMKSLLNLYLDEHEDILDPNSSETRESCVQVNFFFIDIMFRMKIYRFF
jgi:hypothetical protein